MIGLSLSGGGTGFLDGKKHLKIPSACHLVAFLKLIQTSIRPGRLSAGSRRSIWLVVANNSLRSKLKVCSRRSDSLFTHRPSAAATPSRLFSRPLRLNVEASSSFESSFAFSDFVAAVALLGAPVDDSSREMPRVNVASKSSRSRIHLLYA